MRLLSPIFFANRYFFKAAVKQNAKKTLAVWEKVITQFPDSKYVPIGYYFSAKVYTRLNDYPTAIKYYAKVVKYYPDYKRADLAHLRLTKLKRVINHIRRFFKGFSGMCKEN
jgi:TolA-binding protein